MKILITTDWYTPVINGVVTSVMNLKSGLERMGHEVRVLTLSGTLHSYEEDGVIYIGSVGVGGIYPNARLKAALSHRYIRELVEWKPNVVHSQCEFSTFFMAQKIAKATGAPLIHTYHTVYENYTHYFSPNEKLGKAAAAAFSRRILNHTQLVIAPTDKVKTMLERYQIEPMIQTIPSGIDLFRFQMDFSAAERKAMRRELGIADTNIVLIYVGRLAKEKNIEELFSFMKKESDQNLRLLLVGDGPYRETLEKENTDSRVIFAGMASPRDVARYYRLGDIFVSASVSETQGLTYIEAMACGLPLLCKKDECLNGVVLPGKTGYLYDDENMFHEKLGELKRDLKLRCRMGKEAAAFICSKYSVDAFAASVCGAYHTALWERALGEHRFPASVIGR